LERTEAFGSAESVKRSYRIVERNFKQETEALRYHMLDPNFLQKVGITHDLGYGHGAKFTPWRQQSNPQLKAGKPSRKYGRQTRAEVSRATFREQ
jgi:hypothetical protein